MSRQEDVDYFLTCWHVWPCTVEANPSHPFMKALKAVLIRLPEEVFCEIELRTQFIVEAHEAFAFCVPYEKIYPGKCENPRFRLETIVIYERCFALSDEAFVALLAHEIAHSIVQKNNHVENENAADETIISWGFKKELVKLDKEKQIMCNTAGQ